MTQTHIQRSVAQHFLAIDSECGLSISFEAEVRQLSLISEEPIFNPGTGKVWMVNDASRAVGSFEATETRLSVTCAPCDDVTILGIINSRSVDFCFSAARPSYGDAKWRSVPLPFRTAVLTCKSAASASPQQTSARSGAEELGLL